jgi:hypothetical protein
MINPIDKSTTRAMVEYRIEQVKKDRVWAEDEAGLVTVVPGSSSGFIANCRRSIGLSMMRFGARLAGFGMQTRTGAQL